MLVASGRTHETVNVVALGVLAGAYAYARSQGYQEQIDAVLPGPSRLALLVSYLIGTFLVTPDLDLAENSVRAKSNWGLLGLLWVPYGALFKHRGLSHSWILGPATRLVYMAMLALALAWLADAAAPYLGYHFSVEVPLGNWRELAFGALIGYYLSQWLHLVADGKLLERPRSGRTSGRKRRR